MSRKFSFQKKEEKNAGKKNRFNERKCSRFSSFLSQIFLRRKLNENLSLGKIIAYTQGRAALLDNVPSQLNDMTFPRKILLSMRIHRWSLAPDSKREKKKSLWKKWMLLPIFIDPKFFTLKLSRNFYAPHCTRQLF